MNHQHKSLRSLGSLRRWVGLALLGMIALGSGALAGEFRVAIALDKGGRDDQSFNSSAYRGGQEAEAKIAGVKVKVVEGRDDRAEPVLRSLVAKNYDLVIVVGFSQAEALSKVAQAYPQKKFVLIDSKIDAPQVKSVIFAEHEGSFLVGALAGWVSQTGKVGFIGGMDIPLIRRFQMGYEAGFKHVRKDGTVITHFTGVTPEAWNNPPKGKELALSQYASGADIIFAAAGATGLGVFDAAEKEKKLAIGVDSNQNGIKPGFILTSMLKRVDRAVFESIKEAQAGSFKPGVQVFGLKDEGVDFAMDENNKKLISPEILKKAQELKASIVAGKISVPDYYTQAGR
jgi:basic membrane protein A